MARSRLFVELPTSCGHSARVDDAICAVSEWQLMFSDESGMAEDLNSEIDMLLMRLDSDLWV